MSARCGIRYLLNLGGEKSAKFNRNLVVTGGDALSAFLKLRQLRQLLVLPGSEKLGMLGGQDT